MKLTPGKLNASVLARGPRRLENGGKGEACEYPSCLFVNSAKVTGILSSLSRASRVN